MNISLRSPKQQARYEKFKKEEYDGKCIFCHKKSLIKEFDHWIIVSNDYWYDTISGVGSAMAAPKRHISGERYLNDEEKREWIKIIKPWFHQRYSWLFENSEKERSMSEHYHKHLLIKKGC